VRRTLVPATLGEGPVLRCTRCGGTWVPRESARAIHAAFPPVGIEQKEKLQKLREAAGLRNLKDGVRYLQCPKCQKRMNRRPFAAESGIVIDRCLQHGVWFDSGELELAASFFAAGGPRRTENALRKRFLQRSRPAFDLANFDPGAGPLISLILSLM
jgi:Zn-finger nucleic acid-binding protein